MSNIVAVLRQVCGTVAATDSQPTQDMQFKLVLFESEHTIRVFARAAGYSMCASGGNLRMCSHNVQDVHSCDAEISANSRT